jgi:hypothetical protein
MSEPSTPLTSTSRSSILSSGGRESRRIRDSSNMRMISSPIVSPSATPPASPPLSPRQGSSSSYDQSPIIRLVGGTRNSFYLVVAHISLMNE